MIKISIGKVTVITNGADTEVSIEPEYEHEYVVRLDEIGGRVFGYFFNVSSNQYQVEIPYGGGIHIDVDMTSPEAVEQTFEGLLHPYNGFKSITWTEPLHVIYDSDAA